MSNEKDGDNVVSFPMGAQYHLTPEEALKAVHNALKRGEAKASRVLIILDDDDIETPEGLVRGKLQVYYAGGGTVANLLWMLRMGDKYVDAITGGSDE